jgi:glycosyltransferase involved in cell wall biosynthesis
MKKPHVPIKILFVITSSGIGGAEKVLYHTTRLLDPERYVASICSLKEKGQVARDAEITGIEVHCLAMADGERAYGWISSITALFRLTTYIMKVRPTIVHSFLFRANIISRIAAFLARVPLSISSVRVMGGEKDYYHTIERVTSGMVDHYITVSDSVKEYLIHKANILPEKITTIYNGVTLNGLMPEGKESTPLNFGIKPHDSVVLSVGRLHQQKGHDYLIRAIAIVKREVPTVKVLIVGEGEEENDLKNLVKSLDLSEEVIFAGLCREIGKILNFTNLFVLPSLWEGMPNAVLEAMAAAKPVVATRVGGVPELVVDGKTGLLVAPQDSDALAHAIVELLRNNERARRMGNAGRKRVREHFSLTAMIAKTDRLYQELLNTKKIL